MVPPVLAPGTSGAGPLAFGSLVPPVLPVYDRVGLLPVPVPPEPPHAAKAKRAAPATSASDLLRLIVQPFSSVIVPRGRSGGTWGEDPSAPGLGVEGVAHGVTQEVEGQHEGD